jgi:chaperonin GroEL
MPKRVHIIKPEEIKDAVDGLYKTVGSTLGPGGNCVIISHGNRTQITKDGVSIAREIGDAEPVRNTIFRMIVEAAGSVSNKVGDGTTSATLIACRTVEKYLDKYDWPITYKKRKEIEKHVQLVIDHIKENIKWDAKDKDLKLVANISSNGDDEITNLSLEAIEKVGKDGVVLVDYSADNKSRVKTYDGYRLKRGMLDPRFSTIPNTYSALFENPIVVVGTKPVDDIQQLAAVLDCNAQTQRPLVFFTNAVEPGIINLLADNADNGRIRTAIIGIPGTGRTVKDFADDIATYCGVKAIHENDNTRYSDVVTSEVRNTANGKTINKYDQKNNVEKIVANMGSATVIAKDMTDDIKNRAAAIKQLSKDTNDKTIKDENERRASTLLGSIAEIQIGGSTGIERAEKYDRLDDTVHAIQSALKEGVSWGAGYTMANAGDHLHKEKKISDFVHYVTQVVANELVANESIKKKDKIKKVLDPAGAIIHALEAGTSAALNLLSAKTIIIEDVDGQPRSNSKNK